MQVSIGEFTLFLPNYKNTKSDLYKRPPFSNIAANYNLLHKPLNKPYKYIFFGFTTLTAHIS